MNSSPVRLAALIVSLGVITGVGAACGDDSSDTASATAASVAGASPVIDPGDGGEYRPELDPAGVADVIDNPYLPMAVGSRWLYEGESDGEVETVEIVVTGERRTVMGISAYVVRDTVTIGGALVEDTYDWFAQDEAGNVWYLGEEVKDYENGVVVSTEGSWEAGVDGALPGIVMPATPKSGDAYRQELYAGEAEDMMQIIGVGQQLTVAAGAYDDVVITRDWSPLDPDVVEEKYYARSVGKVREEKVAGEEGFAELVEYTAGG